MLKNYLTNYYMKYILILFATFTVNVQAQCTFSRDWELIYQTSRRIDDSLEQGNFGYVARSLPLLLTHPNPVIRHTGLVKAALYHAQTGDIEAAKEDLIAFYRSGGPELKTRGAKSVFDSLGISLPEMQAMYYRPFYDSDTTASRLLNAANMYASDQQYRKQIGARVSKSDTLAYQAYQKRRDSLMAIQSNIDTANIAHLKNYVEKYGWPHYEAFPFMDNLDILVLHASFEENLRLLPACVEACLSCREDWAAAFSIFGNMFWRFGEEVQLPLLYLDGASQIDTVKSDFQLGVLAAMPAIVQGFSYKTATLEVRVRPDCPVSAAQWGQNLGYIADYLGKHHTLVDTYPIAVNPVPIPDATLQTPYLVILHGHDPPFKVR